LFVRQPRYCSYLSKRVLQHVQISLRISTAKTSMDSQSANITHRYFSHICYDLAALYSALLASKSSINFNAPLNGQKIYVTLANTKFLFKFFAYHLQKVTLDSSSLSVGNTLTPTRRRLVKVHVNLSSLSDFG